MTPINITDAGRRDVAARLRKAIGIHEFAEVLGFSWTDESDWVWNDVSNLVADLIEPTRQCPYYHSDRHYCSIHDVPSIDRDALLALAEKLDGLGDGGFSNGWSSGTVNVGYFARCIRAALGCE